MCDNVRMISSQRQHLILSRLRTRGAVRITALSKELGVSAMTIRRDIADLADKGLLKRVLLAEKCSHQICGARRRDRRRRRHHGIRVRATSA